MIIIPNHLGNVRQAVFSAADQLLGFGDAHIVQIPVEGGSSFLFENAAQIIGGQGNGAGGILQRQVLRIVGAYVLDAFMYDIGMLGVRVGLDTVHKTVNRMVQPVAQGAEAAQGGDGFLADMVKEHRLFFLRPVFRRGPGNHDDKLRSPGFHPVQPSASGSQKGGKQFLELLSGAFPIPV